MRNSRSKWTHRVVVSRSPSIRAAVIKRQPAYHRLRLKMIGTRLAHYDITGRLGSGGMGDVYQARDSRLGRSVAIKVLPDEFARDPERIARLEREARVLASLNHPNIAAVHGLEDAGGRTFLVME